VAAKEEFTVICFYPGDPSGFGKPCKYHVRNFSTFLIFAMRKGFLYYNIYNKRGEYIARTWIKENFPSNKNNSDAK